jgi:hypothetical protein
MPAFLRKGEALKLETVCFLETLTSTSQHDAKTQQNIVNLTAKKTSNLTT